MVREAGQVAGQLYPFLVERAHTMAREVAEREAELEDHVLASARPEVPAFRDERAGVVTGEQDDGERHAGIRLELLHERSAVGRLLADTDRPGVELRE